MQKGASEKVQAESKRASGVHDDTRIMRSDGVIFTNIHQAGSYMEELGYVKSKPMAIKAIDDAATSGSDAYGFIWSRIPDSPSRALVGE